MVLAFFLISLVSQLVLPLLHAREVDARECEERSCKGHPRSHVEADWGPSHHDSNTCGVCQCIYSAHVTEIPASDHLAIRLASIRVAAPVSSAPAVRDSLPPSSSPRSPPAHS